MLETTQYTLIAGFAVFYIWGAWNIWCLRNPRAKIAPSTHRTEEL